MIAFIDDHRGAHGVEPICRVLPIAPSTYHDHMAKRADPAKMSVRARRDMAMKVEVARVFAENFRVYGVRKVWRQMRREGFDVARCTVERLMRSLDLQGVIRGKPVRTTLSDRAAPCPLDHVNRQFNAPRPNTLWVSDFTYVATWQGFVYVAFVIDTFARRIVGWRASRTAHASFVLDALEQALHDRRLFIAAASSITATAAASTCPLNTPNGSPRPGSSLRSAASETAMTTRWPRPSTVFTRPRSFTGAALGGHSRPLSSPPSNG